MKRPPRSCRALLMLACMSGTAAAQVQPAGASAADAFQAGRALGTAGIQSATATVNAGSGVQAVPHYGGQAAESSIFAGGRNPIGGVGLSKQSQCGSTVAASAYAQQECDAVNFLARNPTTRSRFQIDAHTDPLITSARTLLRATKVIPGVSSQQCRVEHITRPASTLTETCTDSYWVDSSTCEKVLVVNTSSTRIDQCPEGSLMPLYFSGWGGGVGYWIDAVCQNDVTDSLSLQYAWWNGNDSTKNDGGRRRFPLLPKGAAPDPAAFNASNAVPLQQPGGDLHALPTFIDCDADSCDFRQYQCNIVASGIRYDSDTKTYLRLQDGVETPLDAADVTAPNRYLVDVSDAKGDAGPSTTLVDCNAPIPVPCDSPRPGAYCHGHFTRPGHRQVDTVSEAWDNQCAALEARSR